MPTHILLVEDNLANLELMCYLLQAFGYTPQTASNGQMGFEAATSHPFDMILCDIHMPILDGYQLAYLLKNNVSTRLVPLVAITALAMVGDRERILSAGFDGYLPKPIDPENFVKQVEAYLPISKRKSVVHSISTLDPSPGIPLAKRKILVVDNLKVNLELAHGILEPHGYHVISVDGIELALELARKFSFDLILSDVCMTGQSGYDFIRIIREDPLLKTIPFIFLTSTFIDEKARATGLALGANRYLFRPIEPEILLAEIEACLQQEAKAQPWQQS